MHAPAQIWEAAAAAFSRNCFLQLSTIGVLKHVNCLLILLGWETSSGPLTHASGLTGIVVVFKKGRCIHDIRYFVVQAGGGGKQGVQAVTGSLGSVINFTVHVVHEIHVIWSEQGARNRCMACAWKFTCVFLSIPMASSSV